MKPLLVTILAAVGLTVLAFMYEGFFGSTSVCSDCGRKKMESRIYWIPRVRIDETALSRVHDRLAGGKGHEHHWLFGTGGGGAITCALGSGRNLYGAINREEASRALELIRTHHGDDTARVWLGRLLDPKQSHDATFALSEMVWDGVDFEDAYQERLEFEAWRAESEP